MRKSITLAQQLAKVLASWGVKFIFGTAGDSILPFLACLGNHPIRFVALRNEESAAYAASAYAKLTGELGVVLADGGPGTGHLVNGLADAKSDRAPVLALTGQVESMYLGTGCKQYINQQQLLGAVTLRSENLGNPRSVTTVAVDLIRTARSRGGPVHLSIPKDFWQHKISASLVKPEPFLTQKAQSPEQVRTEAAAWLAGILQPMILAGMGARQAVPEILALAERLGAGIVHTLPMAGVMPRHPLVVGGIGAGGSEAAVRLLARLDGLIKVGATYWPPALTSDRLKVLSIDAQPENISGGIPADFGVVGDAKAVLAGLLAKLDRGTTNAAWKSEVERQAAAWQQRLAEELAQAPPGHPGRAVRVLSELAHAQAVLCLDVGDHVLWFNRFFQGKGQEILVSGRWRGMGFSLGAGIAAQLARPERQVISIVGDGGFSMLMGEFASAVQLELPIIFVLMNNRAYAMEANAMASGGLQKVGVGLGDIHYDKVAEACGGVGFRVGPAELEGALAQAQMAGKSAVIDLQVDPIPLPTAHL